ncbi:acyltransferase [Lacrimispora sp.]|jgi:surface polysaccharide O-acyltransferase-like enzyme|uniref:acyltransferase n=1 Tax=Lacrimispora sp. TaxID=2719234 RepID=UPI0028B1CAF9|nr:acyltransferase [Lacrimispora sp.]
MSVKKTNYYAYLDRLRTIAIISVVLDHSAIVGYKLFYDSFPDMWNSMGLVKKIICSISWEYSRLGVPIFMMISGALILNSKFTCKDDILNFYKKSIIPLVICNEIWVLVYWGINVITNMCNIEYVYTGGKEDISFVNIIKQLLLFKRGGYPNIWYLPAIIGIYFFLPFVSICLEKYTEIIKWIVLYTLIVVYSFTDLNNLMLINDINFSFDSALALGFGGQVFGGGIYIVYIILGYWLHNGKFNKTPYWIWCLLVVLSTVIATIGMTVSYDRGLNILFFHDNDSLLQLLIVISLFELARKYATCTEMERYVARYSFLIYLLHYPVITLLNYAMKCYGFERLGFVRTVSLLIGSFAICLMLSVIIPKSRLVRKYVFHIRE